jgi:hypothetical protein
MSDRDNSTTQSAAELEAKARDWFDRAKKSNDPERRDSFSRIALLLAKAAEARARVEKFTAQAERHEKDVAEIDHALRLLEALNVRPGQ